jgi:hypothetical protein
MQLLYDHVHDGPRLLGIFLVLKCFAKYYHLCLLINDYVDVPLNILVSMFYGLIDLVVKLKYRYNNGNLAQLC